MGRLRGLTTLTLELYTADTSLLRLSPLGVLPLLVRLGQPRSVTVFGGAVGLQSLRVTKLVPSIRTSQK